MNSSNNRTLSPVVVSSFEKFFNELEYEQDNQAVQSSEKKNNHVFTYNRIRATEIIPVRPNPECAANSIYPIKARNVGVAYAVARNPQMLKRF